MADDDPWINTLLAVGRRSIRRSITAPIDVPGLRPRAGRSGYKLARL
jgi:hypothetical protein